MNLRLLTIAHGMGHGGAQIATLELLELLRDRGIDIRLVTCRNGDNAFHDEVLSLGLPVKEVNCALHTGYPRMDISGIKDYVRWADIAWITDVEFLIAPKIKSIRRDLPIVAHLHSYALVCPWWGALYELRDICMEKCSIWRITKCKQGINVELARIGVFRYSNMGLYYLLDFVKGPSDYVRWRGFMRNVVEAIDGFIAVSNALWNIYLAHIPKLSEKPHAVIYNPGTFPLKYIHPNLSEPYEDYIFYASGSNVTKGPHILLEAWKYIEEEYPELKLIMVGCKDSWVEDKAKKLGLRNIEFLNKLPPEQYYKLIFKTKAVVMPSMWPEPFGRIPVEANRLGVPAIVSDRGGLAEIVSNDVNGKVWGCCSSYSLAEAIKEALQKEWSREKIMKYASSTFNPLKITDSLIEFFRGVLDA